MKVNKEFNTYKEEYYDAKGEYPSKFYVRIFDTEYATIDSPFSDLHKAAIFGDKEFKQCPSVYKIELYRFDGALIELWERDE